MAVTFEVFQSFRQYIADGTIDLDTDTINLALVTDGYTKDLTDTIWSEISGSEVATGTGYTTGGATLASSDVTYSTVTGKWDATDVSWTSLTKVFRFGVLYKLGTANAIVNPLIGIILFNDAPADITISGMTFTVSWAAAGIYTVT